MDDRDEDLRLAIYRSFAATGRAPTAAELGLTDLEWAAGTERLAAARHVALADDGSIAMAHPFASVQLGFSVLGRDTVWFGGCAWDSFALPHLLTEEPDVLVATRCPACGRAHAWVVGRAAPPEGDEVAHFLVPTSRIWDDVVFTCGHQRLFCDRRCVDAWLASTGHDEGYVMDLPTLWRLARGWYAGRLDRGYTRKEPSEAAAYFAEVGLHGSFWGLED